MRAPLALIALILASAVACSSNRDLPGCTPGASVACACPDGRSSTQICEATGQLGPCACVPVPAPDAAPTADASPDGDAAPTADTAPTVDTAPTTDTSPELAPAAPDLAADVPPDASPDAAPDLPFDLPPYDVPPLPNGQACVSRTMCDSGYCVDGVCCDSPCTGTCRACALPHSRGTCEYVPDGNDPDNECSQELVASCKRDGFCDGQGLCRKYPPGTPCAAPSCSGTTESAQRICDGAGICLPAMTRACPGGCAGGVCPGACGPASPCLAGLFCDQGTCRALRVQGQRCQFADQCATGYCVDGVCCGSACTGSCQVCNLPDAAGICSPVPINQDPASECPADPNAACGRVGGCDGQGACRLRDDGTPCGGGQVCAGTTESSRICNGRGSCVSINPRSCAPYRCQGIACGKSCLANYDCAPGAICQGGACLPVDGGP